MNVLLCLNEALFRQLFVLVYSIRKNNPNTCLHFFIFERGLSDEMKSELQDYCNNMIDADIEFFHVHPEYVSDFAPRGRITIESYFRLLLVDLLPTTVKRVLYLDIDIIVNKNLYELYNTDLKDLYLAACPTFKPMDYQDFVKLSEERAKNCYFNAGVILFNLEKMRDDKWDVSRFKKSYLKLFDYFGGNPPYEDQGLLNYCFGDQAIYLYQKAYNLRSFQFNERGGE